MQGVFALVKFSWKGDWTLRKFIGTHVRVQRSMPRLMAASVDVKPAELTGCCSWVMFCNVPGAPAV